MVLSVCTDLWLAKSDVVCVPIPDADRDNTGKLADGAAALGPPGKGGRGNRGSGRTLDAREDRHNGDSHDQGVCRR